MSHLLEDLAVGKLLDRGISFSDIFGTKRRETGWIQIRHFDDAGRATLEYYAPEQSVILPSLPEIPQTELLGAGFIVVEPQDEQVTFSLISSDKTKLDEVTILPPNKKPEIEVLLPKQIIAGQAVLFRFEIRHHKQYLTHAEILVDDVIIPLPDLMTDGRATTKILFSKPGAHTLELRQMGTQRDPQSVSTSSRTILVQECPRSLGLFLVRHAGIGVTHEESVISYRIIGNYAQCLLSYAGTTQALQGRSGIAALSPPAITDTEAKLVGITPEGEVDSKSITIPSCWKSEEVA